MHVDPQLQKSFSLLVAAAFADGSVTDNEMSVLHRKALEFRIPMARLDELLDEARSGRLRLTYPSTPAERDKRLDDILDVITADGRIETPERQFMLRYATVLGGVPTDLNERIASRMKRAARAAAPPAASEELRVTRMPASTVEIHPTQPSQSSTGPGDRPPELRAMVGPAGTPSTARPESGPTQAFSDAGSQITSRSDASIFDRPPGPVELSGPSLLGSMTDLPPITLALVKQVIEFDGEEEAAAYLQKSCLMDAGAAKEAVAKVLRTHPEVKPRARQIRHGLRSR